MFISLGVVFEISRCAQIGGEDDMANNRIRDIVSRNMLWTKIYKKHTS